jgi:hypothetical protein
MHLRDREQNQLKSLFINKETNRQLGRELNVFIQNQNIFNTNKN